jgi:hypothetical protein
MGILRGSKLDDTVSYQPLNDTFGIFFKEICVKNLKNLVK